jgi:hypothetical protein
MLATQPKTFDKRDRAIKAALATLGADAKEGADFELEKILTTSGQKTVTRYQWNKLDQPAYQPNVKDRVHNIHDQVDGVLRPDIHGTVLVVGPTVSEVKWDKPAPWGQMVNCLNKHLQPVDNGIPGFLKVENRKPLTPEQKAKLEENQRKALGKEERNEVRDFSLPKNIEPAGREILRAQQEKRKPVANGKAHDEAPAPKEKGRKRGKHFPPEHVITVVSEKNPKQPGSAAYDLFAMYKPKMTVAEYLKKAGPRGPFLLRYDTEHKFITIGEKK